MDQESQSGGATGETPAESGSSFDWGFDKGPDPEASGESLLEAVEVDTEGGPSPSGEPTPADATKTADLSGEDASSTQKPSQEPTKPDQDGTQPPESASQVATEKFKFLGKEYDSVQQAEQVLGSWEGRIQAVQREAEGLKTEVQRYYDYAQDVYRKNQELVAQLETGKQPGGQDPTQEDAIAGLDWKQIRDVTELARQTGHDPVEAGLKMVAEQLYDNIATRMQEELQAVREPLELRKAQEEAVQLSYDMFVEASKARGADGQLLYPELWAGEDGKFDPEFARSMYSAWSNLARTNPHMAFSRSREGVDYAYRLTRDSYTPPTPEPKPGPTDGVDGSANHPGPQPTPARNAKGQFVKAQHAEVTGGEPQGSNQTPIGQAEKTLEEAINDDLFARLEHHGPVILDGEDMGFPR